MEASSRRPFMSYWSDLGHMPTPKLKTVNGITRIDLHQPGFILKLGLEVDCGTRSGFYLVPVSDTENLVFLYSVLLVTVVYIGRNRIETVSFRLIKVFHQGCKLLFCGGCFFWFKNVNTPEMLVLKI